MYLSPRHKTVRHEDVSARDLQCRMRDKRDRMILANDGIATVIKRMHAHISRAADDNRYSCTFEVPMCIIGSASYDLAPCIQQLMTHLEKRGFTVEYVYPRTLFIFWQETAPTVKPSLSSPSPYVAQATTTTTTATTTAMAPSPPPDMMSPLPQQQAPIPMTLAMSARSLFPTTHTPTPSSAAGEHTLPMPFFQDPRRPMIMPTPMPVASGQTGRGGGGGGGGRVARGREGRGGRGGRGTIKDVTFRPINELSAAHAPFHLPE